LPRRHNIESALFERLEHEYLALEFADRARSSGFVNERLFELLLLVSVELVLIVRDRRRSSRACRRLSD